MNAHELIAEVERLAEAATPGPWTRTNDAFDFVQLSTGEHVADPYSALPDPKHTQYAQVKAQREANAAFIAAMRTLAPALARALKLAIEQRDSALWDLYRVSPVGATLAKDNMDAALTRAIEAKP